MKKFIIATTLLFVIFIFLAAMENCSGYDQVLRVRDGKVISFVQMIEEIRTVNVIFVGETHDNEKHHKAQLAIIKSLRKEVVSLAIGLEMFRSDSQKELDQWVEGGLGLGEFLKVYDANWGLPWPLYKDIFLYSRENKIPLFGLNVPDKITEKVSRQGFSSLTGEELEKLPPGISCDVDAAYMDFIRSAYRVHDAEGKSFVHFCEAQVVWDKTMAWNVTGFLEKNPRRTVIVLAGTGHLWKRGIPGQIGGRPAILSAVILPEIPGHIERKGMMTRDADYILLE